MRLIGVDADCPVCGAEIPNQTLDLDATCLDEPMDCPECRAELQMTYNVIVCSSVMTWDDWEAEEEGL